MSVHINNEKCDYFDIDIYNSKNESDMQSNSSMEETSGTFNTHVNCFILEAIMYRGGSPPKN